MEQDDNWGSPPPATLADLHKQVADLRAENERTKQNLITQGTEELAKVRAECAAVAAERDALRQEAGAAQPGEVTTTDVPTLEQEIVARETALAEARAKADVDEYERLAAEHAKLSTAYARSLRQRARVA